MHIRSFAKVDIAVRKIDTAIELLLDGKDSFSALTLAGAGEEILGKLIQRTGQRNALNKSASALVAIHDVLFQKRPDLKDAINSLNRAKNASKHMHPTNEDCTSSMDPTVEAEAMLYRAIENYYALTGNFSPRMLAYLNRAIPAATLGCKSTRS